MRTESLPNPLNSPSRTKWFGYTPVYHPEAKSLYLQQVQLFRYHSINHRQGRILGGLELQLLLWDSRRRD